MPVSYTHLDVYKRQVHLTECGDWRLEQSLRHCGVPIHWHQDSRFLCTREAFAAWAKGRKQLRMEFFYREMRRTSGLLLNPDGTPEGGAWNFDADNRKALPKGVHPPAPLRIEAVSYTHLDVYKRQVSASGCWPGPGVAAASGCSRTGAA